MSKSIQISEIFGPTVQGEGALMGQPTIFVRTGGCDYRCSWCDTMHAVDTKFAHEWTKMSADEILNRVDKLSDNKVNMITVSGGNPALQPLDELISKGHEKGYQFALETQGSLAKEWFSGLDVLTLSPKGPSSGNLTEIEHIRSAIERAGPQTQVSLKIVVFEDVDYIYAKEVADSFPDIKCYLQVGNPYVDEKQNVDLNDLLDKQRALSDKVLKDEWHQVAVLPQMHVLLWGNQRGV